MKNKIIWLIIGLLVIGGIAWLSASTPAPTATEPVATSTTTPTGKKAGFNVADVATHNTPADCYTIVGDKVYGLSSWIDQHPGGAEAIISLCGVDGTAAFTAQHGSSGKAQRVLESYFVGQLIK